MSQLPAPIVEVDVGHHPGEAPSEPPHKATVDGSCQLNRAVDATMSHLVAPLVEVDVGRHGGEDAPADPPPKPTVGGPFQLDKAVIRGIIPDHYRCEPDRGLTQL